MSKSTKIIAALGVVAGIGAAALPMASYARNVDGNVDLYVEVPEAIAMTIAGNNDDNLKHGTSGANGPVNVFSGKSAAGEEITAGTVDGHTVAASTTVHSSSYAILSQNAFTQGELNTATGSNPGFKSTITVYTNAASGYDLTGSIATGLDTAALTQSGTDYNIPAAAITGTQTGDAYVPGWGYKVARYQAEGTNVDDEATGATQVEDANFSAMPLASAPANIDSLNSATHEGRETVVLYGVQTAPDQAAGVYSTTLLYTATTK